MDGVATGLGGEQSALSPSGGEPARRKNRRPALTRRVAPTCERSVPGSAQAGAPENNLPRQPEPHPQSNPGEAARASPPPSHVIATVQFQHNLWRKSLVRVLWIAGQGVVDSQIVEFCVPPKRGFRPRQGELPAYFFAATFWKYSLEAWTSGLMVGCPFFHSAGQTSPCCSKNCKASSTRNVSSTLRPSGRS